MTTEKHTILGLRTCIYMVGDINRAKAWYTEAFGTPPYFDHEYYVGFNIGGYELGLQPEEEPTIKKTDTVMTYWGVEDIEAQYERFLQLGATEHEPPNNVGGDIVVAMLKDPWGNNIGLIYNPEFNLPKAN